MKQKILYAINHCKAIEADDVNGVQQVVEEQAPIFQADQDDSSSSDEVQQRNNHHDRDSYNSSDD